MGLFDKKYCDICGSEIKIFGNRKLEDGQMCKDCESKLSEWFDDRRHSTVAQIKDQLEYREKNKEQLKTFNPTKIIGKKNVFYIDEEKRLFAVSNEENWREANPDLISFDDIKELKFDIKEKKEELMDHDSDGKEVSYNPPKYEYEYSFDTHIDVNNKYFDEMNFEFTDYHPTDPVGTAYNEYLMMVKDIVLTLTGKEYVEDRSKFTYPVDNTSDTGEKVVGMVVDVVGKIAGAIINRKDDSNKE